MANFSINNINTRFSGKPEKSKSAKSMQAQINMADSFKPSLKSASSTLDIKAAAKIFSKKADELPNIRWEFKTGKNYQFSADPAFGSDGTIFIKSSDRNIYAVNPENGEKLWDYNTGTTSYNSPTVGPDNILFFDTDATKSLCAVDGKTGNKLWEQPVGCEMYDHSPQMGPDGNIYVSNDYHGQLLGFDPNTGDKKVDIKVGRHHALLRGITDNGNAVMIKDGSTAVGYNIKTGEQAWESPVSSDNKRVASTYSPDGCLYAGNIDGKLTGIDGKTGRVKWQFNTGSYRKQNAKTYQIGGLGQVTTRVDRELLDRKSGVESAPVIGKDGKIYFNDYRGILFAMDPDTGKPAWIYDSETEITTTPLITEKGEVFIGNSNKEVVKLDAKTGQEIWKKQIPYQPTGKPVVTGDDVLFVDCNTGQTTCRFSTNTGRQLLSYETPGRDHKMAVLPGKSDTAIIADYHGRLFCVGKEKYLNESVTEESSSKQKDLRIEKGKEFIDIGGVRLKIKKDDAV